MSFLEKITGITQGDQATSTEMIQARTLLPEGITEAIPDCIMGGVDGWNWDVINALLYVRLKRDDSTITQEAVALLPNRKNQRPVVAELLYFYGDSTREQIKLFLDMIFSTDEKGTCDKCDHGTLASWRFCPQCGESLAEEAEVVDQAKKKKRVNPTQSKTSSKA